jgi:hypothetical protein
VRPIAAYQRELRAWVIFLLADSQSCGRRRRRATCTHCMVQYNTPWTARDEPDSGSSPSRDPERSRALFWIPSRNFTPAGASDSGFTGSGSRLGLDPHSGIRNQFDRKSVSAGSSRQPDKVRRPPTSNVQPAGRRPLLGGVLRWCTPGGLPDIWGALPRRRVGSRTPSPGWADTARHLGTSPLLAVPSFLLKVCTFHVVTINFLWWK